MTGFDRKALRAIFESADIEVPPKDVLGKLCDLHTQTSDDKDETIKELKAKLESTEHERDELKGKDGEGYKAKFEAEHKAFEDFKNAQAQKETQAAKEKAAKAFFEAKGITGANLDIAMRGAKEEISGLELDGDKIKDAKALADLVSGTYAGLIVTKTTQGAATATPPTNTGGGSAMSKADILAIKDTGERQKAIAANLDLFKKG